jgi:transcription regulator MmyB-like protein
VHDDEANTRTSVVADLRRATGRFPDDPRLRQLVDRLLGNERFAELRARSPVAAHREDHKIVQHPSVGPVEVDCDVLTYGDLELKIVILTAAPDTEAETKLRLAMVAGAGAMT